MVMIKLQYLLRAPQHVDVELFAGWALGSLAPALLAQNPGGLFLTMTTSLPPRLSIIPFQRKAVALLSLWVGDESEVAPWTERLVDVVGRRAEVTGWRVIESIPVESLQSWPVGMRTPGAGLLTLLRRKPGLGDEELIRRWHQGHTPLSLKMHPLWRYVRNVTEQAVVAGSPELDGIVEEHFRDCRDLLQPMRFFGGPPGRSRSLAAAWMVPNMIRTAIDVGGFLEMSTLESFLVEEFRLRSVDD